MKFILPSLALLCSLAAAQLGSVEVSEFVVIKSQDASTKEEKVDSVTFILNGYNAADVACSDQDPLFKQSYCFKDGKNTFFRYFLEEGNEGSGIDYAVSLSYFDQTNK